MTVTSIPRSAYCYIADIRVDENRTNLAQYFTMIVASDDDGKRDFRKRVYEAGKNGYTFCMQSPTRKEMQSIFQDILSADDIACSWV